MMSHLAIASSLTGDKASTAQSIVDSAPQLLICSVRGRPITAARRARTESLWFG